MHYLEAEKIKKDPFLYFDISGSRSWILKENFIYRFFEKIDRRVNILDIGCGNGFFLDKLAEMGFSNLHGADIANYLKNKSYQHTILDINVEKLPFGDASFDIVTAFQVLEHLENYFLILQETRRILKSGGYFILAVPNPFNIFDKIRFLMTGNLRRWNLKNNHLLFLTKDVFAKTYLYDFELVNVYYAKSPAPLLSRFLKRKWKILPRGEFFSDRVCYILKKK